MEGAGGRLAEVRDIPAELREACRGLFDPAPWLPPWLFYDEVGSALFEAITHLEAYDLTRVERGILTARADALVGVAAGDAEVLHVIELGAGTATKTQLVLDAVVRRQGRCRYVPIDVSPSALAVATARLAQEAPAVTVTPVVGSHAQAMPVVADLGPRRLVLFLGSSIGNSDDDEAVALLTTVGRALSPGDALLLGADRCKAPEVHLPAYDDPAGVTAAFNRNVLVRLAREGGVDVDPRAWRHEARWNAEAPCVEMHLVALRDQRVTVPGAGAVAFAAGASIRTESSHKYDRARIARILAGAGFAPVAVETDAEGRFDLHLAQIPASPGAR